MFKKTISGLVKDLQKIGPRLLVDAQTPRRLELLQKLGGGGLHSQKIFYVGGGYDSATAYALCPEADTVINVSYGKLYDLAELGNHLEDNDYLLKTGLVSFDKLPMASRDTHLAWHPDPRCVLQEFARMYILDKSVVTDLIPSSLVNGELLPDADGTDLRVIYSTGRTVEILHCDYTLKYARTNAINDYIRRQAGLCFALVKSPMGIFTKLSYGYYNFYQTLQELSGIFLQDPGGEIPFPEFCHYPKKILFDSIEYFGYSHYALLGSFQDLVHPLEFYDSTLNFYQTIRALFPD